MCKIVRKISIVKWLKKSSNNNNSLERKSLKSRNERFILNLNILFRLRYCPSPANTQAHTKDKLKIKIKELDVS